MRRNTSSPISPPTGTVISTTCEYNPVQSTLLNSPDSDGSAFVIPGKYTISFLGRSLLGLGNVAILFSCLLGEVTSSNCLLLWRYLLDVSARTNRGGRRDELGLTPRQGLAVVAKPRLEAWETIRRQSACEEPAQWEVEKDEKDMIL